MNDAELYHLLFNAITDALEAMEAWNWGEARKILISAQQRAEEGYLEREESPASPPSPPSRTSQTPADVVE